MTNILTSRCKKIVKKDINWQNLPNVHYLEAKMMPKAKLYEIIIAYLYSPNWILQFFLIIIGGFDQYFGVKMQKNSEKVRKLQKVHNVRYLEAKVAPEAKFYEIMFSTSI